MRLPWRPQGLAKGRRVAAATRCPKRALGRTTLRLRAECSPSCPRRLVPCPARSAPSCGTSHDARHARPRYGAERPASSYHACRHAFPDVSAAPPKARRRFLATRRGGTPQARWPRPDVPAPPADARRAAALPVSGSDRGPSFIRVRPTSCRCRRRRGLPRSRHRPHRHRPWAARPPPTPRLPPRTGRPCTWPRRASWRPRPEPASWP